MPKNFQLAIQGGGARLADLLAAAEVVQQFEKEQIRLTRLAGTSAGSIVAALLAAGEGSIEKARQYLDQRGDAIVNTIVPAGSTSLDPGTIVRLCCGRALCRGSLIYGELLRLFQHVLGTQGKVTFSSLQQRRTRKTELAILAANLLTRGKQVFSGPDDDLIDALVHSCAIPLVFRGASDMKATAYVDGGICENLPSGELHKDTKKYGDIIAMSFPDHVDGRRPSSTMRLVWELFSTAINNSVERAAAQLPECAVLRIESSRKTLDFKGAFKLGPRRLEFAEVQRDAKQWLEANIDNSGRPQSYRQNDAVLNLMAELYDWYMAAQSKVPRRSISSKFIVKAYSLANGVKPETTVDEIRKVYEFAPVGEPLGALLMGIGREEQQSLVKHRIKVHSPAGKEVKLRVFPVVDRTRAAQGFDGHLVLFEPSLPPMSDEEFKQKGAYRLVYDAEITGGMAPLKLNGKDQHVVDNTRDETFDHVEIITMIPEEFHYGATAALSKDKQTVAGGASTMTEDELRASVGDTPLDLVVAGWKAHDFGKGSRLEVNFVKIRETD